MAKLTANTELDITFGSDTLVYNRDKEKSILYTKEKTKAKSEWLELVPHSAAKVPAGTTWTFWCIKDTTLAEEDI